MMEMVRRYSRYDTRALGGISNLSLSEIEFSSTLLANTSLMYVTNAWGETQATVRWA